MFGYILILRLNIASVALGYLAQAITPDFYFNYRSITGSFLGLFFILPFFKSDSALLIMFPKHDADIWSIAGAWLAIIFASLFASYIAHSFEFAGEYHDLYNITLGVLLINFPIPILSLLLLWYFLSLFKRKN